MRRALPTLLSLAFAAAPASAEVRHASFHAAGLDAEVPYLVDLPASYGDGSRYPVLYLLHGLFEDYRFWERRGLSAILDALRESGAVPEFVVVAVGARNTFFVNSPLGRYEDLITADLLGHVESSYDVLEGRAHRALGGVSMGGYAALRIALKRPDLFAAAATHSAMLLQQIPTRAAGARRGHMEAFERVFGSPIDGAAWAAADPLEWAKRAGADAPPLYFDCGDRDRYGLQRGNRALHRILETRGVAHEFALHPGDHGYEYVRSVLERSLRFVGERLGAAVPAAAAR